MLQRRLLLTLARLRHRAYPAATTIQSRFSFKPFHTSCQLLGSSPFKLFDIGEGIVEVEILKWHVQEGQVVEEFDPLCEVQSDKSVVELTSHAAGTVMNIQKGVGDMVKVGQILCVIDSPDEGGEREDIDATEVESRPSEYPKTPVALPESLVDNSSSFSRAREVIRAEESSRVNTTEEHSECLKKATEVESPPQTQSSLERKLRRRHPLDDSATTTLSPTQHEGLLKGKDEAMDLSGPAQFTGEAAILPSATLRPTSLHNGPIEERQKSSEKDKKIVKASPAVRVLAARLEVDLATVNPTGNNGRVTKDDVELAAGSSALSSLKIGRKRSTTTATLGKPDEQSTTKVEFGRTRKVMWRALGEQAAIPHFGYCHTLNLTPLLPYLQSSKPSSGKLPYLASDLPSSLVHHPEDTLDTLKSKPTLLSLLIKSLVLALEEHPVLRSKVKESDGSRWLEVSRYGIIGVAVSDPKHGLLTPSLPALPPSTLVSQITSQISKLRENASRPSPPPHLTISSVGGLGEATGAMPVVPPGGGLAICAVGRAKWEVEWKVRDGKVFDLDEEQVKAAGLRGVLRAPVGWSADHRVLEGAELIAFTETWKKYVEDPSRWIGIV
ncbi:uncharacterized protein L203_103731 [Cryptococcus depauperatus CBS 7841]|uniref:Dihydrolipoamide acetyltransferase component of pyruvate dehydrogenase complex n=1 Tax=Cryptococcus depauperatus CBS 7841 TaxID=1295531 RepID=A0AAJ8JU55_9TREE